MKDPGGKKCRRSRTAKRRDVSVALKIDRSRNQVIPELGAAIDSRLIRLQGDRPVFTLRFGLNGFAQALHLSFKGGLDLADVVESRGLFNLFAFFQLSERSAEYGMPRQSDDSVA